MRARAIKLGVRFVALGYLAALLVAPLLLIFKVTFQGGRAPGWDSLSDVDTVHAAKLTFYALAIAVICNTLFGIAAALYLAHRKGPLPAVLGALLDLPLALSPVVVGLALVLVFANTGCGSRNTASRSCSRSRRSQSRRHSCRCHSWRASSSPSCARSA